MKKSHLQCAVLFSLITMSANATLVGRLPTTPSGTGYQAYYDDQLDITWAANANISGRGGWWGQKLWATGLDIDGVTGWRLPSMDVNDDDVIVECSTNQAACMDNEYGHLFHYGAGMVFGSGITARSPDPFSNVQSSEYWSGTAIAVPSNRLLPDPEPPIARSIHFGGGWNGVEFGYNSGYAWAVHSGDVGAVPVPAAVWLFGSGLSGLIGVARRKGKNGDRFILFVAYLRRLHRAQYGIINLSPLFSRGFIQFYAPLVVRVTPGEVDKEHNERRVSTQSFHRGKPWAG